MGANHRRQVIRHLKLYPRLLGQSIKSHSEYNLDFWMGIVSSVAGHLATILFLSVLYQDTPAIAGWTSWQVLYLYGLAVLSRAIASTLFQGLWTINGLLAKGEMDKLLVRPVSPFMQIISSSFGVQGLGHLISGSALLVMASVKSELVWDAHHVGWLIIALISGCLILVSVLLIAECVAFWTGGQSTNLPFLAYQIGELGRYPMEIYPGVVRSLVTWVLPFAFGTYYPAAAIFDKPGGDFAYLSPIMAMVILVLALNVWGAGLRRYTGTGS